MLSSLQVHRGCGKSYWVKEFLKEYRIIHPKRPIYLFTGLTEIDKHFAKLIDRKVMRRVVMDQVTIDSISLDDFRERTMRQGRGEGASSSSMTQTEPETKSS